MPTGRAPRPGEPGGHVCGAAAELDDVLAGQVSGSRRSSVSGTCQMPQEALRPSYAGPVPNSSAYPIPGGAIGADVLGQGVEVGRAVVIGRSTRW